MGAPVAKKSKKRRVKDGQPYDVSALVVTVTAIAPDGGKILTATGLLDSGDVNTGFLAIYDAKGNPVPLKIYLDGADIPKTGCTLIVQNSTNNGFPTFRVTATGIKTSCGIEIDLKG